MPRLKFTPPQELYAPDLSHGKVKKRVAEVLDWCDLNLFEEWAVPKHSVNCINKVFGQQQNDLSRWLRGKLLIQRGSYWNDKTSGAHTYRYELVPGAIKELRNQIGDVRVPLTFIEKMELQHAAELESFEFVYNTVRFRQWSPLQNIPRALKSEFWGPRLPYDYDVNACAPTLLYQTAIMLGADESELKGVKLYLDNKTLFREHVVAVTGCDLKHAKDIITSLFNGASLKPHPSCKIFETLGQDIYALDRLKSDQLVRDLRKDIDTMWNTVGANVDKDERWDVYFQLECEVMSVVHNYLRETGNKFFNEHDGWRCEKPVDLEVLMALIESETGYQLKFSSNH